MSKVWVQFFSGTIHSLLISSLVILASVSPIAFKRSSLYFSAWLNLPSKCLLFSHLFLDESEELFYRVDPWRILTVEEHMDSHILEGLKDHLVLMDPCIVHKDDDILSVILIIHPDTLEKFKDKVLEDNSINPTFDQLSSQYFVLTHCREHRNWERLNWFGLILPNREFQCTNGLIANLISELQ